MAPRRAIYLYAATIAVADREVSLLMTMGPASIGKRLSSRMLSQCPSKPQIGRLIKNAWVDISISLECLGEICLFFKQPLTG